MNPYQAIDDAYDRLAQRRPPWIATLTTAPVAGGPTGRPTREQLDRIVATVNADPGNTPASDDMLRRLIAIGRHDSDAITVILRAFIPRLLTRIHKNADDEYHADVVTALTMVCLDSDLTGTRLAMRLLNRAHNRAFREGRRVRIRGEINTFTTNPIDPEVLREIHDFEGLVTVDHADHVADVVDLQRFHAAVRRAVEVGLLPENAWDDFRDLKLARALNGGEALGNTRRTRALRAAKRMEVLIDRLLCSHAA
jgi:hypothetical protein